MVLTRVEDGVGLEWGGIAAARQRFVWHERMRGSIISRGMHVAGTASRPEQLLASAIRSSLPGSPARREGHLARTTAAAGHGIVK